MSLSQLGLRAPDQDRVGKGVRAWLSRVLFVHVIKQSPGAGLPSMKNWRASQLRGEWAPQHYSVYSQKTAGHTTFHACWSDSLWDRLGSLCSPSETTLGAALHPRWRGLGR